MSETQYLWEAKTGVNHFATGFFYAKNDVEARRSARNIPFVTVLYAAHDLKTNLWEKKK